MHSDINKKSSLLCCLGCQAYIITYKATCSMQLHKQADSSRTSWGVSQLNVTTGIMNPFASINSSCISLSRGYLPVVEGDHCRFPPFFVPPAARVVPRSDAPVRSCALFRAQAERGKKPHTRERALINKLFSTLRARRGDGKSGCGEGLGGRGPHDCRHLVVRAKQGDWRIG